MKLKTVIGIFCMLCLSMPLVAQRTVTNRLCPSCRPYEQYQVNAQGNRHGYYKTWNRQGHLYEHYNYRNGELHGSCIRYFATGVAEREETYINGECKTMKLYEYIDNKRYLMGDYTLDKTTGQFVGKTRDKDSYGKLSAWRDTELLSNSGKLPNGTWDANYYLPYYIGCYAETYTGNDTIYVWRNKTKRDFLGKYIDQVQVYSEADIIAKRDKAIQDSIVYAREREEENRLYLIEKAKEQAIQDSIEQVKTDYNKLVNSIIETNASYKDLLTNGKYSTEYEFYSFLCKYIKKKKDTDSTLSNMIMDILEISSVKDLEIKAVLLESNITSFQTTYTNEGITITNKQDKTKITALKPYYNVNFHFTTQSNWNLTYTVPEDILANYNKQRGLLDIILYCKEHNIIIK